MTCFGKKLSVWHVWLPYAPFLALYAHDIAGNISFDPCESAKKFGGIPQQHTGPPSIPKSLNSTENSCFLGVPPKIAYFGQKSSAKHAWLPYALFQALRAHNIVGNVSFDPFKSSKNFGSIPRQHKGPLSMPKPTKSTENG